MRVSNTDKKIDLAELPDLCDIFGVPVEPGTHWLYDAEGIGIGYGESEDISEPYYIGLRLCAVSQDSDDPTPYWITDLGIGTNYTDPEFVENDIDRYVKIISARFPHIKIEKLGWDF